MGHDDAFGVGHDKFEFVQIFRWIYLEMACHGWVTQKKALRWCANDFFFKENPVRKWGSSTEKGKKPSKAETSGKDLWRITSI